MFKKTTISPPNYVADSEKCIAFLSNYTDRYDNDRPKYMEQLQSIANRDSRVLEIALDDVEQHFSSNPEFITSITHNTRRYQQLFYKAADSIMPAPTKSLDDKSDIYDILNNFRQERLSTTQTTDVLPHELKRRYELHLIPRTLDKPLKLRAIKAKHVGSLVSVKGIVTRTTDVLPLVKVVTYLCDACGCESYQTVDDRTFNPLQQCPSQSCIKNDIKGKLHQLTRGSKFVRYQEIKLQELHTEVPIGHIPRTITLRSFGELTRQCKPGDLITVTGIFLPIKYEGFRAVRAGLTADTYMEVTHLVPAKQSYSEYTLTPELEAEVESKSQEKDIYSQLAQSIAPEIYGHEDIKKALVLLLVSGVNRHMEDGMKIRGDINVLLMGDPGVAKSQLLKHITTIAPRAVYTTGKGSSGVGLTAAVLRDPTTGEMTLEGGALVLADMGICCIDEFDKMEDADRTAIHEVMEQQTVSIAKAGIVTTLNARTSILAAANPVYGRWKLSETPETNLGLPTALLSRFDLTFIILDKPNEANDEALARHITHVHRENTHPPLDFTPFSSSFLRAYVAKARSFTPYIPNDKELMDFIVGSYVGLRKEDDQEETLPSHKYRQQSQSNNNRQRFCTARSLLSILRLSQGLARIHMRHVVTREDVEEAIRLLYVSKNTALEEEEKVVRLDPMTRVFNVIKNYCQENKTKTISRADLRGRLFAKNLSEKLLDQTLVQYEELDILKVSRDRQTITIISGN